MKAGMTAVLLAFAVAGMAYAEPVGTSFTYQGILSDSGVPADGVFDFRFILYDAASGGSQVGSMVEVGDVTVADGRATVQVDCGAVFGASAVWLEVAVRDGASTGAYTVLSPRQKLTATPLAQYAATASDADQLDGRSPAYYLEWSNLSSVPQGLDDGDDDTLGELSCAPDEIAKWTGSAWSCATNGAVSYSRTYLVGPVGTQAENGAALLAAMAAIPDRTGSADFALLMVEPGWYDLGGGSLVMKAFVDVQGAGSDGRTSIRSARCGTSGADLEAAAVVVGGQGAELRDVEVENTCTDTSMFAVCFYNDQYRAKLRRVYAYAFSAPSPYGVYGIHNAGGSLKLSDVEAYAYGTTEAYGIYSTGDGLTLDRVNSTGQTPGGIAAEGIRSEGINLRMNQVEALGYGALYSRGIRGKGRYAILRNVTSTGSNPSWSGDGIWLLEPNGLLLDTVVATGNSDGIRLEVNVSSPNVSYAVTLLNVTATGADSGIYAYAATGSIDVTVDHSRIRGTTNSIYASGATFGVGASQLSGGAVSGTGLTCAGIHDEYYGFYPDSCP